MQITTIDIGNSVVCDSCNKDYTNSDAKGGILVLSKAICPECQDKWLKDLKRYGEEYCLKDAANAEETFRDFVLRLRGGNNTMSVTTFESADALQKFFLGIS